MIEKYKKIFKKVIPVNNKCRTMDLKCIMITIPSIV